MKKLNIYIYIYEAEVMEIQCSDKSPINGRGIFHPVTSMFINAWKASYKQ